ncbi:putative phenylalanyl-tRNA synthetase alpha chain [Atta colombica]|uniref:phenylalanine--tRNA ligase n=2 Tax=Atta colombica TaxID=520822 RepID=A0A195B4J1_9HYME|nr:PREDICTED: phenylalanine--tRNA ligase alpha subunit isoform X1 [Atta colombica]KYM79418.1 putative phenylalanyl-tRNA synthetase alpha chain [Atta colombica]
MASYLTDRILEYLDTHGETNSLYLADILQEDHQKIVGAIKSLETIHDLITVKPSSQKKWEITDEGKYVIEHGSHEAAVYNAIPDEGISQAKLIKSSPYAKVGFSKAMVIGWIGLDKSGNIPTVRKKVPSIIDSLQIHLKNLTNVPENLKAEYKKRKLLQEVMIKIMHLEKGPNFSTKIEKLETDLTSNLLVNGAWKDKKFKPYNFDALGASLQIGHLHPLLKVRHEFRKIFLEMGFTEMPSNNYIESSFWNFDALFQPQQHPARDAHDTFFISEPCLSTKFPMEYLERVRTVHSKGAYGSQGYRYDWKLEEAQKNLLRTHTTSNSARMLYKLMEKGDFKPIKYFSIDRVFRNETLDATHLAEFHQVEGVVADYNLTLGNLIGILYEFFSKLGITQLRFKPAYNPYTEPSMEIFCFHNGLEKWIEIGNSGMFRPEMLLPMNLPPDVNIIAWGLSLERPTMIKYGLNNIRDLVGPKVDMEMVHNNPLCRLEKTSRMICSRWRIQQEEKPVKTQSNQEPKIKQVAKLSKKPKFFKQELVIFCDPKHPIYFIEPFLQFISPYFHVSMSTYIHSTVANLPDELASFGLLHFSKNTNVDLSLTIIWKTIGLDPIMVLPRMHKILGMVNIARYLNRLIEQVDTNILKYETNGLLYASKIDLYLDKIHCVLHDTDSRSLKLCKKLHYIMGKDISIIDFILKYIDRYGIKKKS